MALINLSNVSLSIPLYSKNNISLKKKLLNKFNVRETTRISKDNHVSVINNLSLSLKDGDKLGVYGKNGSGKTSLLRLMNGVYTPTTGTVVTTGKIASLIDISGGFDAELSGYENIILRGLQLGKSYQDIVSNAEYIIQFSEIEDFIYLPMRTYSSGMVMRLAFSIMIILDFDILIMDEWLSVGDQNFVKKAERELMERINKSSILVIASHSLDLLKKISNKILYIETNTIDESI
jgi:lipopolysaccharide transport system ATP-binding protein